MGPASTTVDKLLASFDLFLLDAYGVLMTSSGPLPGAREFLQLIQEMNKEFFIITNDASRTPESCAAVYLERGFRVPIDRILSAGVAIAECFREKNLSGSRAVVLGTSDTNACVARAGGVVVEISDNVDFDVLVIGDDSGFDFLPTMNALLTATHQLILKNRLPVFLLANPDLLYPRATGSFGFTSGSVAKFLEVGLCDLHPKINFKFEVLGKPSPLLFELAMKHSQVSRKKTVMLGDQLHTDIVGANRAGFSSCLLATGITQLPLPKGLVAEQTPTFVLHALSR